jgi:Ras-related protein Rab-8A
MKKQAKYEFFLKFLILGEAEVGKTSIYTRYFQDTFDEEYKSTIGIDFKIRFVTISSKVIKLQIWDRSGKDSFNAVIKSHYKEVSGILLVYDVTNKDSFDRISDWDQQITENAPPGVVKTLVANKIDLNERVISTEDGQNLANLLGMKYTEVSAKENLNVTETFSNLAKEIYYRLKGFYTRSTQVSHKVNNPPKIEANEQTKPIIEKKQESHVNENIVQKNKINENVGPKNKNNENLGQKNKINENMAPKIKNNENTVPKNKINDNVTNKELTDLKKENENLKKEIQKLNDNLNKGKNDAQNLEEEVKRLNNELETQIENSKNLEQQLEEMKILNEQKEQKSSQQEEEDDNKEEEKMDEEKPKIIKTKKRIQFSDINECTFEEMGTSIPLDLEDSENILTVIFAYQEKQICIPYLCKSNDKFSTIEKMFYEKYPDLKKEEMLYYVKGNKIKKAKTMEENNITNFSLITFRKKPTQGK